MAKYNVKRSCGHEEVIQLYGKAYERRRRLAFLEANVCTECLRQQNLAILAEDMDTLGMCDLTGTEKQRPYAAVIRHTHWQRLEKWLADSYETLSNSHENGDVTDAAYASLLKTAQENEEVAKKVFSTCDKSSWWIDRKDLGGSELFRQLLTFATAADKQPGKLSPNS